MKVLFDTNVILDAVLARVPFVENAAYLFEAVELGKIQGFISDGAWFYSFLRVLRHDFCSIVSNERFLIQNRVIEAFPTPKAEK